MARRRLKPDNESGPTLRDLSGAMIEVACVQCDRRDLLKRKTLVAQFGVGASLARLRRRFAMGCEQMCTPHGDKCGTKFISVPDRIL